MTDNNQPMSKDIDKVEQNPQSAPRPFPEYESHCHGAPVKVESHQRIKYFCTECGEPCIARKKK